MKKNRLLILGLLLSLVLSLTAVYMPAPVQAKAKVHKVKNVKTWKKIAKYKGGKFKLTKNIKLTSPKQYLTLKKNKKYVLDLNGHKIYTTYSGVQLRSYCPITVAKGTLEITDSKNSKHKGILYSTEAAAITLSGKGKLIMKHGAIVDDAVEFRSDVTSAIMMGDNTKCYLKNDSKIMSIGNGVAMLGKAKLYTTGHPYVRAGVNNNTGMFTHYGNGIVNTSSGATMSLKGGSFGTKASPDTSFYGVSYAMSANYPVLDTSGKALKTAKGYHYVDSKGAEVAIKGSNLEELYPGIASQYDKTKRLTTTVTDPGGYYTVYVVKK